MSVPNFGSLACLEVARRTCVSTSFHFCQLVTDCWRGRTSFLSSKINLLFYFILIQYTLFYIILFYFISSYFLFYFILLFFLLFYFDWPLSLRIISVRGGETSPPLGDRVNFCSISYIDFSSWMAIVSYFLPEYN